MRPSRGTSASVHPTLNATSLFCTLRALSSRRHERQMQRRFGPAWRFLGNTAEPKTTTTTTTRIGTDLPKLTTSCDNNINNNNNKNRLFDTQTSTTVTSSHIHNDSVVSAKIRTDVRAKAVELGLAFEECDVSHNNNSHNHNRKDDYNNDVSGLSTSRDPLLEFLEKNEEDAAVLLAMWTSLRRSCLHASEISESLSLRARWFLHHLIHIRAIDAAVRFYQRLLTLGVQLQKWDVVLLLSNLPYERSTTVTGSKSKVWMEEKDCSMWEKRELMEKRRRGESTDKLRKQYSNSSGSSNTVVNDDDHDHDHLDGGGSGGANSCKESHPNSLEKQETGKEIKNDKEISSSFSCEILSEPIKEPHGKKDNTLISVVGGEIPVIGTRKFHEQPDWVKRWVLYEASMGNIDMLEEDVPPTTTTTTTSTVVSKTIDNDNDEFCMYDRMNEDDRLTATEEVNRIIEVTALLNHLMLLHDASKTIVSNQNEMKKKHKGYYSITRRKISLASKRSCYWREAFHIGILYISSRPPSQRGLSLPIEFLSTMRRAVIVSGSWKVSLRYLETAEKHGIQLHKKDYVIFILLAISAEPWIKNSSVEQFVAGKVIPKFLDETASGYAIQAIWLSYVCSLKADKPERYMELMKGHTTNLPTAIKQCMIYVKLATSHLRIEVDRYRAEAAAQEVLATSIKLGLFSHESTTSLQQQQEEKENPNGDVLIGQQNEKSSETINGAILSNSLIDSFRLVCITLPRIVALASVAVDSKESALNISTLLLDTLYGQMGVWGIFSELYMAEDVAAVRRAPERTLIASELTLCVIRITLTLCINNVELLSQKRRGISILTVKEFILLLGIVVEVLGVIPTRVIHAKDHSHYGSQKEEPEQKLMFTVINESSKLVRETFRFLHISPTSEKVLFGSTPEETVEAVVLVVRILLRLHTEFSWTRLVPISTRLMIRSILGHDSGLGKQVRRHLRQREVQHLHRLFNTKRKKNIITNDNNNNNNNNISSSFLIRPRTFSPEDIARIKNTAKLHEVVYSLSLRYENDAIKLEQALTSQLRMMSWNDALTMMHIALHHLRLSPGTLSISFFAEVLECLRISAKSSVNGSSLWLQAVSVYWDAVDHTACRSSYYSSSDMNNNNNNNNNNTKKQPLQKHEKWVLSGLLVPMMLLSMSIMRRDIGWNWLNIWTSLHSPEERDIHWLMLNIRARSALRDSRALTMSVKLFQEHKQESTTIQSVTMSSLESLLCDVAVRHNNWSVALESLLSVFTSLDAKNKSSSSTISSTTITTTSTTTTPLPLPVVTSVMRILGRAPINLSNTALRLRALQGDCWDLTNTNTLLLLLVRQRRWKLALHHVKEMIPLLDTPNNNTEGVNVYSRDNNNNNNNSEHVKLTHAMFLLYGLRACASGGCSEEAAILYDRLKVILGESSGIVLTEKPVSDNRVKYMEDVLFSAAATTSFTAGEEDEKMHAIATQARIYFLRAMTKKMLIPSSNKNERSS